MIRSLVPPGERSASSVHKRTENSNTPHSTSRSRRFCPLPVCLPARQRTYVVLAEQLTKRTRHSCNRQESASFNFSFFCDPRLRFSLCQVFLRSRLFVSISDEAAVSLRFVRFVVGEGTSEMRSRRVSCYFPPPRSKGGHERATLWLPQAAEYLGEALPEV